jgi:hypothetical protein
VTFILLLSMRCYTIHVIRELRKSKGFLILLQDFPKNYFRKFSPNIINTVGAT